MDDQDRDPREDYSNINDLDLSFEADEEHIRPITSKQPNSVVSVEEPVASEPGILKDFDKETFPWFLLLILANLKGSKIGGEKSPAIRGEQAGSKIINFKCK
ncbi:unnamed protein product [Lepeophtheirus salmonis]|uniref:(salmon louse) hypothetical protein n=1 Tax=Lepeophtheirus salmonis TaxID=72036 RepID=A0A7R8CGT9_LEPSM|nr:unnamed protein product [Lepeophtheirus salmonis]CAF2773406.1 unnamed protein product [Lepeophtheirus salmonis]